MYITKRIFAKRKFIRRLIVPSYKLKMKSIKLVVCNFSTQYFYIFIKLDKFEKSNVVSIMLLNLFIKLFS